MQASSDTPEAGSDRLLTPWRVRTYLYAALFALAVAFLIVLAGPLVSGRGVALGGDYVVFYAAGERVLAGAGEELYEREAMAQAQAAAVGTESLPATLAYVYPPVVAEAHAPLAALPYRLAFFLHVLLAGGAVALSLRLLEGVWPALRAWRGPLLAGALCFYPLTRAVAGGQNTAFSLLLLAGALCLLAGGERSRAKDVGAGLLLGLLCYKPNFGLPFLGLALLARRPWALVGGVGGAGGLYLASAALLGASWPTAWWARVAEWQGEEAARNGADLISCAGVSQELLGSALPGHVLAGAVVLGLAALFVLRGRRQLPAAWALATAGVLLLSPHTQFYDAGLLVLPGALLVARRAPPRAIALVFLGGWTHFLTSSLPVQPLFFVVLAAGILALRTLSAEDAGPGGGASAPR